MVNMIGFHHREPEYNTAGPGEEGYYIKIRPLPTLEHPKRAKVSTPTGHGIFHNFDDAQQFMDTLHRDMAETYMEWLSERNIDTQPLLAKVKSKGDV